MKIESVRIQNFRSFKDEAIQFGDYTCFVGANGAGKSTIFYALNIFFRQKKDSHTSVLDLTKDDFHHKNVSEPIKITVTFTDLSDKAEEDLKDYVRQEKLIVTAIATFDTETKVAKVKQLGNRLGLEEFRRYFEADKNGAPALELKAIYGELREKYPDLSAAASTKKAMTSVLQAFEETVPEKCDLIPSEDQFYGVSKGVNKLAPHIQWIFVSASKNFNEEAEESKHSALGQLLGRTIRSKVNFSEKIAQVREAAIESYQGILDEEQSVLSDLSSSLGEKLKSWAHPDVDIQVQWQHEDNKSIRVEEPLASVKLIERGFESSLSRFGHGLQRSYMLALLQEIVSSEGSDEEMPTLVMAIEEPELYQHPPQERHLASVLQDLSSDNAQVLVCSHSSQFIPADDFEAIRIVRESGEPKAASTAQISYDDLATDLHEAGFDRTKLKAEGVQAKLFPALNPQINEMFFCKHLVLVEGIEDVAYLTTYLTLSGQMEQFRRKGAHIVPVGGKSNLLRPIAVAKRLQIPVYVVFDGDTDKQFIQGEETEQKIQRRNREVREHKKDNASIKHLLNDQDLQEWPDTNLVTKSCSMWVSNITKVVESEIGDGWLDCLNEAFQCYGQARGLKKNPLAISHALERAWNKELKSDTLLAVTTEIARLDGER